MTIDLPPDAASSSLIMRSNVFVQAWDGHPDQGGSPIGEPSHSHNLIVTTGLNWTRDFFAGERSRPQSISVGTGTTAVALADTALETETFNKAITRRYPEAAQITFQMLMLQSEGNGVTITEVGLFQGTVMIARAVISPGVAKTASIFATIAHQISFANP